LIAIYDFKIITTGNTIEVIQFGVPIKQGEEIKVSSAGRSKDASEKNKLVNRYTTMRRARTELRRLVQANNRQYRNVRGSPYEPIFLTLTFAENIQDFDTANHEFKLFIMRLGYMVSGKKENSIKYVAVPEFQKRGAIHYHLVIFNMPYIPAKKIADIWRNGFIKVNKIDHVDNVGAYICKYLGKDLDDERLRGKKSYFTSRGLIKPTETTYNSRAPGQKEKLEAVIETAQALSKKAPYTVKYPSDHYDVITYTQYNI
jgi:hypothetical protein